jgi:hypothetical protein
VIILTIKARCRPVRASNCLNSAKWNGRTAFQNRAVARAALRRRSQWRQHRRGAWAQDGNILITSYLFGLAVWLFSAVITFTFWGFWGALFLGLILLGVGIVPMALLAVATHSQWNMAVVIVGGIVLTFGTRIIGLVLSSIRARRNEMRSGSSYPMLESERA